MLAAIITGALAGWLASIVMHSKGGLIRNIIFGVVGGFVGNFVCGKLGWDFASLGFFGGVLTGAIGACIVIFVARIIAK